MLNSTFLNGGAVILFDINLKRIQKLYIQNYLKLKYYKNNIDFYREVFAFKQDLDNIWLYQLLLY